MSSCAFRPAALRPVALKLALPLAFAALALAGCTPKTETAANTPGGTTARGTTGTTADANKPLQLAFVCNNASDFWTIARKGTEQAVKELKGVTVDFKIPGAADAASAQTGLVNDLLAKGIQGMAISPVDPANQTDLLNDAAAKTLVFTQDSDAPNSNRACYIGTDNEAAGQQAGEELKKALPNGGKVMVFVGKADAQNAKERYDGLKKAVAGSNIQILDLRTDDTDRVRAKSNVSDTLVKTPDLAGCVGLWSYNGPAIVSAVKEANKVGKVKIVCFDEEADTLAGVKSGAISATIVQQPYEFGLQSIKTMAAYLRDDKSVIPASKKVIIPTLVIDGSKVDEFKTKLDALRG